MPTFLTPQDIEAAFYRAFEAANVVDMMALWADLDDIICVHPMGGTLRGRAAVEQSWREIFSGGPKIQFQLSNVQYLTTTDTLAVHILRENIILRNSEHTIAPVISTNIYRWLNDSWRMILHHASLTPPDQATLETQGHRRPEKILH
jgi:ketosteroid isomerase-like protein